MKVQKNVLILIGLVSLAYIIIFLLAPKDITDYTVVDTEYWRETNNRLLTKTAYEYNSQENIKDFPQTLGNWKSFNLNYSDSVVKTLNADIILSRAYVTNESIIWLDFINSKTGESFHNPKICVTGAGFNITNESIAEFKIADPPNPFTKLYTNMLDINRKDERQIMVYWFMFKKFGSKDAVTMIRITSPVAYNETDTFGHIKAFIEGQLFDTMYKKGEIDSITNMESISNEYGSKGMTMLAVILLIPLGMIVIGIKRKN